MPYGTVGPTLDLASNTYTTHFEAEILAAQQKKTNSMQKKNTLQASRRRRSHARHNVFAEAIISTLPASRWLKVMQMQLAPICIRQELTDAQMADRQRRARHLWQSGKTGGHFV